MAVVTVEKAQLWDEALQTQVHKVETIAVKAAKGYVLQRILLRNGCTCFSNCNGWMGMLSPMKKVVMNISLTASLCWCYMGTSRSWSCGAYYDWCTGTRHM